MKIEQVIIKRKPSDRTQFVLFQSHWVNISYRKHRNCIFLISVFISTISFRNPNRQQVNNT